MQRLPLFILKPNPLIAYWSFFPQEKSNFTRLTLLSTAGVNGVLTKQEDFFKYWRWNPYICILRYSTARLDTMNEKFILIIFIFNYIHCSFSFCSSMCEYLHKVTWSKNKSNLIPILDSTVHCFKSFCTWSTYTIPLQFQVSYCENVDVDIYRKKKEA